MSYSDILRNIGTLRSTFGSQFVYGLQQLASDPQRNNQVPSLLCSLLSGVRQADTRVGGAGSAPNIASQQAWNDLFTQTGCGHPFPSAGVSGSRQDKSDISRIIPVVQAATQAQQPAQGPSVPPPTDRGGQPYGDGGGLGGGVGGDAGGSGDSEFWSRLAGIGLNWLNGAGPCPAAILPTDSTYAQLIAGRGFEDGQWFGIIDYIKNKANWAYSNDGGTYSVPACRFGLDTLALDPEAVGAVVPIYNAEGEKIGTPTGGGGNELVPTGGTSGNVPGLIGVEPVVVPVRRCPGRTVLAVDGKCYDKRILPSALRMNRSKKAPVSYRDALAIRKGTAATKRIERYANKQQKWLRSVTRRTRPRRTTTHTRRRKR